MKNIIFLLIGVILIAGCSINYIGGGASPQLIKEFNQDIGSAEEAQNLLLDWLNSETDFNSQNNKIENIQEHQGYYDIKLTTSIKINGIEEGILGYRDYRVSKDGKLLGYYYSK